MLGERGQEPCAGALPAVACPPSRALARELLMWIKAEIDQYGDEECDDGIVCLNCRITRAIDAWLAGDSPPSST